jgi:hypothetical protein
LEIKNGATVTLGGNRISKTESYDRVERLFQRDSTAQSCVYRRMDLILGELGGRLSRMPKPFLGLNYPAAEYW